MLNMPNVAMNGLTRRRVTTRPFIRPSTVPKPSPTRTAIHTGTPVNTRRAANIADAASMEPTDRSIPPVTMIMVWPMAMMPIVDMPRRTLKMFSGFEK